MLAAEDGTLDPVPAAGGGHPKDPELERLSAIVRSFNDYFGNIEWNDADRVQRFITEEIPRLVSEDEAYRNAQTNNDPVNARVESDRALSQVLLRLIADDTQLFKEFQDNISFKRWLAETVFTATYRKSA